MAEHKQWLWRKKSSDKSNNIEADKDDSISKRNEEEMHKLLSQKAEMERDLLDLTERLSTVISECDAKDELAKKHAKTAQEALAGWEKVEAKALSLKQELSKAVQDRLSSEARTSQLDAALKECMQQLHFVREQQEHRIHDALTRALQDFENARLELEEKLAESTKRIIKLGLENDQLTRFLMQKEQLIEDLNQQRDKADRDMSALQDQLESLERENNSLKYEVRLLQKELDIRNEEREFARKTAEATHKQHLESARKIARLESECQRLCVLVKKRLPGPAALAKMKNEVEILERVPSDNRRKMQNRNQSNLRSDYAGETSPQDPSRNIGLLIEKLCSLEEENNALRESLQRKTEELQGSRNVYAQAAARLFHTQSRQEHSSPKAQKVHGCTGQNNASYQPSSVSISDDVASDAGSWACALITELEHFRDGKPRGRSSSCRSNGASEASLMDDFLEMEKVALVSADDPIEESPHDSVDSKTDGNPSRSNEKTRTGDSVVERKSSSPVSPPESSMASCKLPETPSSLKDLETSSGNSIHTFQGKTSDLATVLQRFLHTCDGFLKGNADFRTFVQEVTSTMEWMIEQYSSLKDVSSVKDAVRKLLDWVELQESELASGVKKEENTVDFTGEVSEHALGQPLHESNALSHHHHKAEMTIDTAQAEGEGIEPGMIQDQTRSHSSEAEDLDSQLSATIVVLEETHAKISSLEGEIISKSNIGEEMQTRDHELQLQLESATKIKDDKQLGNEDEKQLRTDQEILAASEKLAQCQETILNLGKQLKALASPNEAVLFDKLISTSTSKTPPTTEPTQEDKKMDKRTSLLDKMLADDDDSSGDGNSGAEGDLFESPKTKEIICDSDSQRTQILQNQREELHSKFKGYKEINESSYNRNQRFINSPAGSLAIVPSKHKNAGFFKKLLWKRKKGNSKKPPFLFLIDE